MDEKQKKWIEEELARIRRERRQILRKKRKKTRKILTGVWRKSWPKQR